MGAVKQYSSTVYDECVQRCQKLERRYEDLYARVQRLAQGDVCGDTYAPEGSCLAFLRWEELRRSEEMRRTSETGNLIQRRLAEVRLEGFSDAVTYLAKLKLAYVVPELGEIG